MIQSLIEIFYITVKFDDGNGVVKTGIHHKVLLQGCVRELHVDKLKIYTTGFSMAYNENVLVHISNSTLWLILMPQLRKITQRHQTKCRWEIWIQTGHTNSHLIIGVIGDLYIYTQSWKFINNEISWTIEYRILRPDIVMFYSMM